MAANRKNAFIERFLATIFAFFRQLIPQYAFHMNKNLYFRNYFWKYKTLLYWK